MKKALSIVLATILIFAFSACSDDDNKNVVDSSIVGTWKESSFGYGGSGIGIWTFKSDGTGILDVTDSQDNGSYIANFTFSYDGKILKVAGTGLGEYATAQFNTYISSDGKTMKLSDEEGTRTLNKIIEIDK